MTALAFSVVISRPTLDDPTIAATNSILLTVIISSLHGFWTKEFRVYGVEHALRQLADGR